MPTGREEVWRFTPIRRLRGLLDGEPSDGRLKWDAEVPAGVTITEITAQQAVDLGETLPADRPSALAAGNAGDAVLIDVAPETELPRPLVIRLSGTSVDDVVWGHIVVRVGIHAKAT